jgi:RNA polymerase sigma factor (sigma-70 family)
MRNESPVRVLLESAAEGAEFAWRELTLRYSPLIFSMCGRFGLTGSDAEDVAGNVWLRLVISLGTLRDPEALPGWLATTTRRECMALMHKRRRETPDEDVDDVTTPDATASLVEQERRVAVRDALTRLSDRDRELLSLVFADPPLPYDEISSRLGMPRGSIGPIRQRCLARVRRVPAVAALIRDIPHGRTA